MSTSLVSLPVNPGGLGAGEATQALQASKIIILSNDLVGTINIEARNAAGGWCTVASFSGRTLDKKIEVACSELRVNSSNGSVSSVDVMAERGTIRFGDVPTPPANGPGASLDMIQFGCLTTIIVSGLSPAQGGVNIEISADDVNWEQAVPTFQGDGCKTFDASARYIRAVGAGATATIAVGSEEPAVSALTAPVGHIVFREDATGINAPGGNVYTTWAGAYEALQATAELGERFLEFDSRFSTKLTWHDRQCCEIPVGTWDMTRVTWTSNIGTTRVNLLDGTNIVHESPMHIFGRGIIIYYDGETPGSAPFAGGGSLTLYGPRTDFENRNPAAAPMFAGGDYNFFWTGVETFGRMNPVGAPLIDLDDGFCLWAGNGGMWGDGTFTDTSVGGTGELLQLFRSDGASAGGLFGFPQNYSNPALPATATVNLLAEHRDRMQVEGLDPGPIAADYNQLVLAITIAAPAVVPPVLVTLPSANPARGERVWVKDASGNADNNNIIIGVPAGQSLDGFVDDTASIVQGNGCKQFVSDGAGGWWSC